MDTLKIGKDNIKIIYKIVECLIQVKEERKYLIEVHKYQTKIIFKELGNKINTSKIVK